MLHKLAKKASFTKNAPPQRGSSLLALWSPPVIVNFLCWVHDRCLTSAIFPLLRFVGAGVPKPNALPFFVPGKANYCVGFVAPCFSQGICRFLFPGPRSMHIWCRPCKRFAYNHTHWVRWVHHKV